MRISPAAGSGIGHRVQRLAHAGNFARLLDEAVGKLGVEIAARGLPLAMALSQRLQHPLRLGHGLVEVEAVAH